MIRLSKLADYAIVLLTHFARGAEQSMFTARDLAADSGLPLPTVSKVLKSLSRGGLLVSHRGVKGGYSLAKGPDDISVVEVIYAIDGPIALTECSSREGDGETTCELQPGCPVRSNWQKINDVVVHALSHLTLTSMTPPVARRSVATASPSDKPHPLRVVEGSSP